MQTKDFKIILSHTPSTIAKENWIYLTTVSHYRHLADPVPFYRNSAPNYQMFFSILGTGWLDYDGKYQIISPGSVVCVDLENRHGFGAIPGQIWEHYWMICGGKPFTELYNRVFAGRNIHPLSDAMEVQSLFKELFTLKKMNDSNLDIKSMAIIMNILARLLEAPEIPGTLVKSSGMEFVTSAVEYIKRNYSQNIKIEALAKNSGYSVFHFARRFKQQTGYSPVDYINQFRIEMAKNLLVNNDKPVSVIAGEAGFNSVNYFIRVFKQLEHMTPVQYRNSVVF